MVDIACSYNIELLAVQQEELTNEDLTGLEAQRKDKERKEQEVTEELKIYNAGDGTLQLEIIWPKMLIVLR